MRKKGEEEAEVNIDQLSGPIKKKIQDIYQVIKPTVTAEDKGGDPEERKKEIEAKKK